MTTCPQDHSHLIDRVRHRHSHIEALSPDSDAVLWGPIFANVCRDRHHHPVVTTLPERLPFFLPNANDCVRIPIDANLLADRIGSANEVLNNIVADHDDVRSRTLVRIRDAASVHDIQVVDSTHAWSPATDLSIRTGRLSKFHYTGHLCQRSADDLALSTFIANGFVVVELEILALLSGHPVFDVGDDVFLLIDDEHIGAEIEYLLRHITVDAVDKRHHRDDRRHADYYSEQRKNRAELVCPKRLQGNAHGFRDVHGIGPG